MRLSRKPQPQPEPISLEEEVASLFDSLDPETIENLAAANMDFNVTMGALYLSVIRNQVVQRARQREHAVP